MDKIKTTCEDLLCPYCQAANEADGILPPYFKQTYCSSCFLFFAYKHSAQRGFESISYEDFFMEEKENLEAKLDTYKRVPHFDSADRLVVKLMERELKSMEDIVCNYNLKLDSKKRGNINDC